MHEVTEFKALPKHVLQRYGIASLHQLLYLPPRCRVAILGQPVPGQLAELLR